MFENRFIPGVWPLLCLVITQFTLQLGGHECGIYLLLGPTLFYAMHQGALRRFGFVALHVLPWVLTWVFSPDAVLRWSLVAVSLLAYAVSVWGRTAATLIVVQVSVVHLALGACAALRALSIHYPIAYDIEPRVLMMMLLALEIIVLARYVYVEMRGKADSSALDERPGQAAVPRLLLATAVMDGYERQLCDCMNNQRLYLKTGFSFDELAQESGIPKHHLSALLNQRIGKSFYQLVAEYRIKEALKLMERNDTDFTLEALAYECGFNSKSSFNRYFKEFVGCAPSAYRSNPSAWPWTDTY